MLRLTKATNGSKPGFNFRFSRCSKHLERQGQEIVIPYSRQTPRLALNERARESGGPEPKRPLIIVLLARRYVTVGTFEGVDVTDNIDSGLASLLRFDVFLNGSARSGMGRFRYITWTQSQTPLGSQGTRQQTLGPITRNAPVIHRP